MCDPSCLSHRKKGREPNIEVCKELGGCSKEGLQMVLGIFPTLVGIPSHIANLEMFTYKMWKHAAVSVCVRECVYVWSKGTLGSRDSGWG